VPLPQGGICGQCLRRPPAYTAAVAAFHYHSPLSDLLIDLKFHGRLALAQPLGELLAERLLRAGPSRPEVIVPVPLHPQRLRERGYNQALELARPVSQRLRIPLAPELGVRLRATASQSKLDPLQRRRNLRGAFGIEGNAPHSVAILDDVITTGSTAGAFAQALRRAGAREIQVWALARAARS
jgi:ComF family protein